MSSSLTPLRERSFRISVPLLGPILLLCLLAGGLTAASLAAGRSAPRRVHTSRALARKAGTQPVPINTSPVTSVSAGQGINISVLPPIPAGSPATFTLKLRAGDIQNALVDMVVQAQPNTITFVSATDPTMSDPNITPVAGTNYYTIKVGTADNYKIAVTSSTAQHVNLLFYPHMPQHDLLNPSAETYIDWGPRTLLVTGRLHSYPQPESLAFVPEEVVSGSEQFLVVMTIQGRVERNKDNVLILDVSPDYRNLFEAPMGGWPMQVAFKKDTRAAAVFLRSRVAVTVTTFAGISISQKGVPTNRKSGSVILAPGATPAPGAK